MQIDQEVSEERRRLAWQLERAVRVLKGQCDTLGATEATVCALREAADFLELGLCEEASEEEGDGFAHDY